MASHARRWRALAALWLAAFWLPVLAASGDAQLLSAIGDVRVIRSHRDWTAVQPLVRGDSLRAGDTIVTGDNGRVQLRFSDGALVTLQPRSRFRIDDYRFDAHNQRSFFSLLRGALRTSTGTIGKRSHEDYRLRTPTATVGIRGTEFELEEADCKPRCEPGQQPGLRVGVIEGRVVVTSRAGSVEVPAGAAVHVARPDALARPVAPRPPSIPSRLPGAGEPAVPTVPTVPIVPAPPAAPAAPAAEPPIEPAEPLPRMEAAYPYLDAIPGRMVGRRP